MELRLPFLFKGLGYSDAWRCCVCSGKTKAVFLLSDLVYVDRIGERTMFYTLRPATPGEYQVIESSRCIADFAELLEHHFGQPNQHHYFNIEHFRGFTNGNEVMLNHQHAKMPVTNTYREALEEALRHKPAREKKFEIRKPKTLPDRQAGEKRKQKLKFG